MDISSSEGTFSEKVRTSQPSLTKRGLTLQVKNDNPSPREEKVAKKKWSLHRKLFKNIQ